jgi:hypothetical protein
VPGPDYQAQVISSAASFRDMMGSRPLIDSVDLPSRRFVATLAALEKDSLAGNAQQVVVAAKAAAAFVNPCGERPQDGRGLMTMGEQPCPNVRRRQFFKRSNRYR